MFVSGVSQKNLVNEAIFSISVKKSAPKDWAYLCVKASRQVNSSSFQDVERLLRQRFTGLNCEFFVFAEKKEIIILADNKSKTALTLFNRAIFDRMGGASLDMSANDLAEKGMEHIAKVLSRHITTGDVTQRIGLARMSRPSNCILILDDDPMVLKTMEFALKGYGFVGAAFEPADFLSMYKEYAPNLVFVDIHLKGFKGTDIVNAVRRQLDPNVYAVMISADSTQDTVVSVKSCGAKGYLLKPVARDSIFVNLMKAPMFVQRVL